MPVDQYQNQHVNRVSSDGMPGMMSALRYPQQQNNYLQGYHGNAMPMQQPMQQGMPYGLGNVGNYLQQIRQQMPMQQPNPYSNMAMMNAIRQQPQVSPARGVNPAQVQQPMNPNMAIANQTQQGRPDFGSVQNPYMYGTKYQVITMSTQDEINKILAQIEANRKAGLAGTLSLGDGNLLSDDYFSLFSQIQSVNDPLYQQAMALNVPYFYQHPF